MNRQLQNVERELTAETSQFDSHYSFFVVQKRNEKNDYSFHLHSYQVDNNNSEKKIKSFTLWKSKYSHTSKIFQLISFPVYLQSSFSSAATQKAAFYSSTKDFIVGFYNFSLLILYLIWFLDSFFLLSKLIESKLWHVLTSNKQFCRFFFVNRIFLQHIWSQKMKIKQQKDSKINFQC